MQIDLVAFIFDAIHMATPIIFAALAALICNKAGMFNMGIEGMMLCSALGAVAFAHFGGNWFLGIIGALIIGLLSGLFIAFASITGHADLYLTCIAFNLAATGGTVFVMYLMTGDRSTTNTAFRSYPVPKFLGGRFSLLTLIAILCVAVMFVLLNKTRLGLRIRAVGENPHAAESVGISVPKVGYIAFGICGLLTGLGGASMSMSLVSFFMKNMVNGRGYIGLSAQNMANGEPIGSGLASLLFGFTQTLTTTLKNQTSFPTEFLEMIPYVATILALGLTGFVAIQRVRRTEQGLAAAAAKDEE